MNKKLFMMALCMVGHSGYAVDRMNSTKELFRDSIDQSRIIEIAESFDQSGIIDDLMRQVKYVAASDLSAEEVRLSLENLRKDATFKFLDVEDKEYEKIKNDPRRKSSMEAHIVRIQNDTKLNLSEDQEIAYRELIENDLLSTMFPLSVDEHIACIENDPRLMLSEDQRIAYRKLIEYYPTLRRHTRIMLSPDEQSVIASAYASFDSRISQKAIIEYYNKERQAFLGRKNNNRVADWLATEEGKDVRHLLAKTILEERKAAQKGKPSPAAREGGLLKLMEILIRIGGLVDDNKIDALLENIKAQYGPNLDQNVPQAWIDEVTPPRGGREAAHWVRHSAGGHAIFYALTADMNQDPAYQNDLEQHGRQSAFFRRMVRTQPDIRLPAQEVQDSIFRVLQSDHGDNLDRNLPNNQLNANDDDPHLDLVVRADRYQDDLRASLEKED